MSNQNLRYTLSLQDLFSDKMKKATEATTKLDGKISGIGTKLKGLVGGVAIGFGIKEIIDATTKFQSLENALNATGEGGGAKNIKFLNEQIDRLGLNITAAYSGYKTFSGALMETNLAGEEGNKIFRQVSEAATVMGLSGEQSEGAFLALGQMMSKGTVSAEELRGQLGERIPGAFQIAAKAMGVTTEKLGDMMKKGEVVASEFLPKFGNELEKRFGKQAGTASNSLQSNLNRMWNEFERLKVQIGNDFLPLIITLAQKISIFFKFIKNNLSTIKLFGALILGLYTAFKLYHAIMALSTIWTGVKFLGALISMTAGLQGATVAQYAMNTAMNLCPILALVSLFVLLIKTINDYKTVAGLHGESVQKAINKGIESEITLVNKLALAYEKHGLKKSEAQKQALQSERATLLADMGDLKAQMANGSIDPATADLRMSGMAGRLQALNSGNLFGSGAGAGGGGEGGKQSSTEISGQKPQTINITINKLVETLRIEAQTIKEGTAQMKEMVSKALLETVNDLNYITK
jgi:tape measure domain-containing protein